MLRFSRPVLDKLDEGHGARTPPNAAALPPAAPAAPPLRLRERLELADVHYAYPEAERPALEGLEPRDPGPHHRRHRRRHRRGQDHRGRPDPRAARAAGGRAPGRRGADHRREPPRLAERDRLRAAADLPRSTTRSAANIAFGLPPERRSTRRAVERAARIAELHDFVVEELPEGYATRVGERGVRLSGGQRQRIGIARALYHDPDVLIMDEATSALDNLTERAVMDAVHNLGHAKTIVLIAHRLSTVRDCDVIFMLERGRVVAQGSYDELLDTSQKFRAMAAGRPERRDRRAMPAAAAWSWSRPGRRSTSRSPPAPRPRSSAHCPGLAVDLFTDAPRELPVFDRVHLLEDPWFRSKIDGLLASRFERTLYMDADMLALADFRDVFEVLDRFDIALAHDWFRNSALHHSFWRKPLPAGLPAVQRRADRAPPQPRDHRVPRGLEGGGAGDRHRPRPDLPARAALGERAPHRHPARGVQPALDPGRAVLDDRLRRAAHHPQPAVPPRLRPLRPAPRPGRRALGLVAAAKLPTAARRRPRAGADARRGAAGARARRPLRRRPRILADLPRRLLGRLRRAVGRVCGT